MEFNAPLVFTEFLLRALAHTCFGHGRLQPGAEEGRKAAQPSPQLSGRPRRPGGPGLPQDGGRHAAALARGWNSMAERRPAAQSGEAEMGGNPTTLAR